MNNRNPYSNNGWRLALVGVFGALGLSLGSTANAAGSQVIL